MSNFLANFQSYFTEEERKSEIYRILAIIGVNLEKSILEELDAEIRRSTEVAAFTDDKLRSLLAFLLTPVRNVVSATGFGRVVVNSIEKSEGNQTCATVPAGSIVTNSNGKEYQIQNDLVLNLGYSTSFTFVQGRQVISEERIYSEFVAIPIKSGTVDLSYVRVFMGAGQKEIPVVPSFPIFPVNLMEFFPKLGSALEEYAGDPESKISLWNPLLKSVESLWDSVQGVSIRPQSGFFPFFFNNTLFIKIFSGGSPGNSNFVPNPTGEKVFVSYRISDGVQGNMGPNRLQSFSEAIETQDGGRVKVTLYNDETFNGANAPSHAELVSLLRKRLFASTHVSSIPEYTAWFLAQPAIGDCLVVSDFERWRLSGKTSLFDFAIKGLVDIYLVDSSGRPVRPYEGSSFSPLVRALDKELSVVKDISFLNYRLPSTFWHFYVVQYRSVFSDAEFISSAKDNLFNLYSISWVRANGSSLFRDLDIDYVTNAVRGTSDVSGLRVIPYHYFEYCNNLFHESSFPISLDTFFGEKPGGWYEYWERDPTGKKLGY